MKITDKARDIITNALVYNGYNCLRVMTQKSCCGTSVYFVLANLKAGDNPVSINGISVLMDDETQVRAKTVIITTKHGKLMIEDDAPSCC